MARVNIGLLMVVYAAFVALGLPDTLLGAAWPTMYQHFGVHLSALGILGVTSALSAIASSLVFAGLRWKPEPWRTLVGSVGLMCVSMIAFGFAQAWWMIVALSVTWGFCGGVIDIQLNHFAAKHFSARHMSWLHGFWCIGAATGPLIFAAALSQSGDWQFGFWALAFIMCVMAVAFWYSRTLWPREERTRPQQSHAEATAHSADHRPSRAAQWLSPLSFFFVVAAEFATAIWLPSIMTAQHQLSAEVASHWATLFFAAMMIGRFAIGIISDRVGNRWQIRAGIALAIFGATLFWVTGANAVGAFGVLCMGLGSAPLFPALMHETTRRFYDDWAQRMIARQMIGAYAAAALMPLIYAALVERFGIHAIIPTAIVVQCALALCVVALDRATPALNPEK